MIASLLCELIMLVFCGLLGMAIMPESVKAYTDKKDSAGIISFFLAPLIGFSILNVASFLGGSILPYKWWLVVILYIISVVIIFLRRKQIHFVKDKAAWGYVICLICLSVFVIYSCIPHVIDGGMYFMGSAYDHQRTALIDAIALGGLPLKWPWMADSGKLIMAVNHCGIHSVMAQPVMLFGIPSYEAGAGIEGLVFIMMMLTVAALAYYLLNKKLSWVFLILVFWIGAPGDLLVKYVSPFWKGLMAPGEYYKGSGYDGFFGFWPISSDILWSPHCAYSGTITLLLIFFYCILLKEREKKRAIHLAAIMGGMAAAAFMGNVYSGMMALFIFFVSLVPVLVLLKDFRKDFISVFKYQVVVIIAGLVLAAPFLIRLLSAQDSLGVSTIYGVLPPFNMEQGIGVLFSFLGFTFITLTARTGIPQLLGIVAMLLPGILPKNRFVKLLTYYFAIISVVIFFCYSSFYSNDLGWRSPFSVKLFCLIGTSVLLTRLFCLAYEKKKILGYALIAVILGMIIIFSDVVLSNSKVEDVGDHETHVAFAKAAEGWKVIRDNTDKLDLVLNNPLAFSDMTYNYLTDSYKSYLYSYFSGRFSSMADFTLSMSIISEEDKPRFQAQYQFVTEFFNERATKDDVRYVARDMNVKAILVTPEDALWEDFDVLLEYYEIISETDGYKVFIRRE